jgi:hypothetical protein
MGHFANLDVLRPCPVLGDPVQSSGMKKRVIFVGTAKSGLGHLRRIASIAARMYTHGRAHELVLLTNAEPAGLSREDLSVFSRICLCQRPDMAALLVREGCDLAVLDTVKLPGFERFQDRAALILRETPAPNLEGFRRAGGRPWDMLVLPNPVDQWDPKVGPSFATTVVHTGWIFRETGPRGADPSSGIIVAMGGGGNPQTRAILYPVLNHILDETRRQVGVPVRIRQALGPRAGREALPHIEQVFDPGPDLDDVFRRADLVISTAGYNSVLELAGTDTPTLLVAIPRSLDDQLARVRHWGPRLGFGHEPGRDGDAAAWLADRITRPRRRAPIELGSGGAARAALALQGLLCPIS